MCIGPFFATIAVSSRPVPLYNLNKRKRSFSQLPQEDFFIDLRDLLKTRSEVSEVHCVKDAKVPLIRFKFDGILVDLPYAQLRVLSIPNVRSFVLKNSLKLFMQTLNGFNS